MCPLPAICARLCRKNDRVSPLRAYARGAAVAAVLPVIQRYLADVQERLIFRAQVRGDGAASLLLAASTWIESFPIWVGAIPNAQP